MRGSPASYPAAASMDPVEVFQHQEGGPTEHQVRHLRCTSDTSGHSCMLRSATFPPRQSSKEPPVAGG
ncbi:uncharacterized [Tachysurus ichikawai]